MFGPLKFAWDAILDRSSRELLIAVIVATMLAMLMSCIYGFARRKLGDNATLATALFVLTSLASMALAAGYLEQSPYAAEAQLRNVYRGPIGGENNHLVVPASRRITR
jgi:hypothetical protein